MKQVLLIAYHFPPVAGSSGVLRTLKFARYLSDFGWQASVLTVHPRAYERTDESQLKEIPRDVRVIRAFALDAARHLAIRGRYPGWLAVPDRWASWLLGAVPSGLRMIRRAPPRVLWATYPVPSALLVGLVIHKLTGVPLIADLRDSMMDSSFPAEPAKRRVHAWLESQVVHAAHRVVLTTPGARGMYASRYPELPEERWAVLPNGYDEEDFNNLAPVPRLNDGQPSAISVLHAGLVDSVDRDPRPFLAAVASLKQEAKLESRHLQVTFRAPGVADDLSRWIRDYDVADLVKVVPPLPYQMALAEMAGADALLLLQGNTCNHQIPAKLYEYLRAGRPILALTDPAGDTAAALAGAGVGTVVSLEHRQAIAEALLPFIARVRSCNERVAGLEVARQHTRYERTRVLAQLLDAVT